MPHLIELLGGPAELARRLKCKPPSVIEWRTRGIPRDRRPDIELHYFPRFTVEQIEDGARWVRVPDPHWPNPAGRPCLDVAAPTLKKG